MNQPPARPHGSLVWTDLLTADPHDAVRFYGELFGWHFDTAHDGDAGYFMCRLDGAMVCSIGDVATRPGAHAGWTLYVAVDSADTSAERARQRGGTVLFGPLDVASEGRLALVADPTGGLLGLWQGRDHVGAEIMHRPGALCGGEVRTPHPQQTVEYYGDLFGWHPGPSNGDGCTMRAHDATVTITADPAGQPEQPGWTVRFEARHPQRVADDIARLGGRVRDGAHRTGQGGALIATDPAGNLFSVATS